MLTIEQVADELATRYKATMTYRTGTIQVNGEERIAVDFMDGRGWQVVDPAPFILARIEQALSDVHPKVGENG